MKVNISTFPLYCIGSLVLSFVLLELLVRLFLPQNITPIHREEAFGLINAYKANISTEIPTGYPFHSFRFTTNGNRLRNLKEISFDKPDNIFRVLMLGDSRVAGALVNDDESYPYYLEKLLNERTNSSKFQVLNAGNGGWAFGEIYTFLKNEGHKYSPDLIILLAPKENISSINPVNGENLIFENIKSERISDDFVKVYLMNYKFKISYDPISLTINNIIRNIPWYENLSSDSHFLNLIRKRLNQILNKKKVVKNNASRLYLDSIGIKQDDRVNWIIDNNLMLESSKNSKYKDIKEAFYYAYLRKIFLLGQKIHSKILVLEPPEYLEVFGSKLQNKKIRPLSLKGINYFSSLLGPLKNFQNKNLIPLYFPMDRHWTPAGNKLMAILTFNFLIDHQILPQLLKSNLAVNLLDKRIIKIIKKTNKTLNEFHTKIPKRIIDHPLATKKYIQNYFRLIKKNLIEYVEKNKNDYEIYYQLGVIFKSEKKYTKAIKYFLEASKSNSFNKGNSFSSIGEIYLIMNQKGKANEFFNKAITFYKDRASLKDDSLAEYFIAINFYKLGNIILAEEYLIKAIKNKPKFFKYSNRFGTIYFDSKRFKDALNVFKNSLKLQPNQPRIIILCGLIYIELRNREKAVEMFETVLRLQPNNRLAKSFLAENKRFK